MPMEYLTGEPQGKRITVAFTHRHFWGLCVFICRVCSSLSLSPSLSLPLSPSLFLPLYLFIFFISIWISHHIREWRELYIKKKSHRIVDCNGIWSVNIINTLNKSYNNNKNVRFPRWNRDWTHSNTKKIQNVNGVP